MKTYRVRKVVEYWDVEAKSSEEAEEIVLGIHDSIPEPKEYDFVQDVNAVLIEHEVEADITNKKWHKTQQLRRI